MSRLPARLRGGLDTSSLSVLNGALVLSAAKRDRRRAIERLERLEQAQAKIVLSFMKDRRATISSVDHMINKSSLLPARDSWHGRASITQPPAIATGEK